MIINLVPVTIVSLNAPTKRLDESAKNAREEQVSLLSQMLETF